MKHTLLLVGIVLVAGWIVFRVVYFVWRRIRRRPQRQQRQQRQQRTGPAARVTCPRCGSRRLDELSDQESGHCLACKHVWGVDI